MARYVYSLVRFVPDPVRGEFINVAAVIGSEETGEWDVRQVSNLRRARALDEHRTLPAVTGVIEDLTGTVDAFLDASEAGEEISTESEPTEEWLRVLSDAYRHVVQLTPPAPLVAASADEAMNIVFDELVVDPEGRPLPYVRRNTASKRLRRAYLGTKQLHRGTDFFEHVALKSGEHEEQLDFAVVNGSVVQLAQAWSFAVPDQRELARRVRAWGWTLRHLKDVGGSVAVNGRTLHADKDVDLEVIYVPPVSPFGDEAFRDASAVFSEIQAQARPVDEADEVAELAVELLEKAS
jgi:hypothetical protein